MGDRLSTYLQEQIDLLDESLTAAELAKDQTDRQALLDSMGDLHTNPTPLSFHTFLPREAKFSQHRKALMNFAAETLDDCFSRQLISDIPKMVSRALELDSMLVSEKHKLDRNPYLVESTRCYVFGLFNSCVALSRSAVEQAFGTALPDVMKWNEEGLEALIKTARCSILKRHPDICHRADEVRKEGNRVIHGKSCKQEAALRALENTRTIVRFFSEGARSRL